ncbi:MAG: biopolymer transporter ExbD [Burkholderiales bacterium]|jgi:biopolymer transport protein ExbD|nr:biopolymer transporter ExbD [Burkholderiales bacterium]
MAFGQFEQKSAHTPMSEINMVPLIDVMLVLLVIFIVTAPLLTHAVKLELPKASSAVNEQKVEKIEFAIDAAGFFYWNGELIGREEAQRRFEAESLSDPQPEIHLRADEQVIYKYVAQIMADASKAGLTRIGFLSSPEKE